MRKTVFILGAGASIPYGFPSGAGLRERICNLKNSAGPLLPYLERIGSSPALFNEFVDAFHLAHLPSIDAFLARNPRYEEMGKLAIAYSLISREMPGLVWAAGKTDESRDDNWYEYLWAEIDAHCGAHLSSALQNIQIATFNYDRSLEFFLHHAVKNTYGKTDLEASNELRSLEIVHLYGHLGAFDIVPGGTGRLYEDGINDTSLQRAVCGLRVMSEHRDNDTKLFDRVRFWVSNADRLVFLGFSFHTLNMERLGLAGILRDTGGGKRDIEVCASTYGMTKREVESARLLLGAQKWEAMNLKTKAMLREIGVF